MHELPLVKTIFKTVISHAEKAEAKKVTRVVLQIGVLRDFVPMIVQKYWDYITPNSIAEGSKIEIEEIPASAECGKCHTVYQLDTHDVSSNKCPKCGFDSGSIVTGNEFSIRGIEIEK